MEVVNIVSRTMSSYTMHICSINPQFYYIIIYIVVVSIHSSYLKLSLLLRPRENKVTSLLCTNCLLVNGNLLRKLRKELRVVLTMSVICANVTCRRVAWSPAAGGLPKPPSPTSHVSCTVHNQYRGTTRPNHPLVLHRGK